MATKTKKKKAKVVKKKPVVPAVVDTLPAEEAPASAPVIEDTSSTDAPEETPQTDSEEPASTEDSTAEPPETPEVPVPAAPDGPSDPETPKRGALKAPRLPKGRSAVLIGLAVIAVVIGVYFLLRPNYTTPLPKSVTQQASFKAYYPQSSDNAYGYAPNSASYVNGKLSYTIVLKNVHTEGASPFVRVSETALVGKGPDLNLLPNFTVFNAPAGKAAISPDGQVLNGVLVTDKTLVILNGLGGVTRPELMQIIKSM